MIALNHNKATEKKGAGKWYQGRLIFVAVDELQVFHEGHGLWSMKRIATFLCQSTAIQLNEKGILIQRETRITKWLLWKKKIDLSKKKKNQERFWKDWKTGKQQLAEKTGISGVQKNRGGRRYRSLTLCICNLDSKISLVAYFIYSVLLIHLFVAVAFYLCCKIQESIFAGHQMRSMFKQLIPA